GRGQPAGGVLARFHARLQFGDGGFLELGRRDRGPTGPAGERRDRGLHRHGPARRGASEKGATVHRPIAHGSPPARMTGVTAGAKLAAGTMERPGWSAWSEGKTR